MNIALRLSIVAVALAVAPSTPFAGGAGTSGQACVTDRGGGIQADKLYGAENWQSSTRYLVCPVRLKNETHAGATRDFTWARAYVRDRNGSSNVQCRVEARRRTGSVYLSSSRYSGTSYKGSKSLTWTSNPLNGGRSMWALAGVNVSCWVPKVTSSGRSAIEGVAVGY